MSDLCRLMDVQMERLQSFFSRSHLRSRLDDRLVLNGIEFVNRNGLRLRDARSNHGPHKALYNRWKRATRRVYSRDDGRTYRDRL